MLQLGLRLHDAEQLPIEEQLPIVRKKGYTCVHLALSKSMKEYPCGPSALTPGYAHYLKHLFEKNQMDVAVLGNYLNLAHPDPEGIRVSRVNYSACPLRNIMTISVSPPSWAAVWWEQKQEPPTRSINTARNAGRTRPCPPL